MCDKDAFITTDFIRLFVWPIRPVMKIGVGCVQGSVLGPLLFNIYMHDLADKIKELNSETFTLAYADDTYVVLPFKDNINQAKTDM